MLPSVLAKQLQEGLIDYIDTTFPITNSVFKNSLKNMLNSQDAVFHDPYIAVRLPFRVSDKEQDTFQAIHQSYSPYVHQQRAFDRLVGEDGRSTLIATGTGSGKTECFLYPILEYCYRHRGEPGIKALIIYPMNALASDQAKRIAELVDENPKLKDNGIRVGMYVGGHDKTSAKVMMSDKVITDHDTLLASPPDILMTNYKMLDYLLVRPKDAELWKNNGPDTLRYIAVDELHTFDGAQGTDLACLLRRLKARLNMQQGQLCCIGTSATMGAKESEENIRKYAEDVFGESFEEDSVITEDRLTPEEFFSEFEVVDFTMPSKDQAIKLLEMTKGEDQKGYLELAVQSWLEEYDDIKDIMSDEARAALGKHLMSHQFTQELIMYAKGNYIQNISIINELIVRFPQLKNIEVEGNKETIISALDALYALISHARIYDANQKLRPFLNVQVQLWMRELRRLMANVSDKNIKFALAGDLSEQQAKRYLPVVNCRDCGQTGWASLIDEQGSVEMVDLNTFYNHYFDCESDVRMIFPRKPEESSEYLNMELCTDSLIVGYEESNRKLGINGNKTIPVWIPELKTSGKERGKGYICPFCGSTGGLSIMGVRSATAISAGISQLYSSRFNDDKKLLAFTDNVQDAAHHAGFYNARTWRFGLRTAIQQYALIEKEKVSMEQFIKRCVMYWKKTLGNEGFVAQFIPSNLTWMNGYERMCKEGSLGTDDDAARVLDFVTKRMEYEILLEYGLSARIGRSLEKSGCSTVAFYYEEAIRNISNRIPNEVGVLHDADLATFDKLVMGILYEMKSKGAFDYMSYHAFVKNNGNKYIFSKIKWMPGARIGRNVPRMMAYSRSTKKLGYFEDITKNSWFTKWISKYLPIMHSEDIESIIIKIILEELTKCGTVNNIEGLDNVEVWAINPDKCTISNDVKQFVCDECGSKISVAESNAHTWNGMCCTRAQCSGHMKEVEEIELDFYGKLYSQGELIRIVSKEHTGLLERADREELEKRFKRKKEEKKPWDANLLSCTPTLEMGIDIGDLSTVIMCSIPPGQSQYAQRAGRGGRKDGNSLTIAVANAKPHDLYFYEDPMEMISGMVEPPRIFLRASAVLFRQFVAYCMDCWVKTGNAKLPSNVGACLSSLGEPKNQIFPHNFLNYVQTNLTKLVRMFVQMFSSAGSGSGGLDEDAIKDIRSFAIGDGKSDSMMYVKILEEFNNLKKQKDSLKKNTKDLTAMIKVIEAKPKDAAYEEQIKDLKSERSALSHVIQDINEKDIFNFLADEGLLPNYAFPESGVTLKAVLYRREENQEEGAKGKSEKMVYEFNRSAASAISEFAPLNSFYVAGRKLNIDQVDVNMDKPIPWRLCPNCAHAEPVDSTKIVTVCPKCFDTGWADAGQIHFMLKVQMVYSYSEYKKNIIDDSNEERVPKFFDKQMLVDVDENHDIKIAFSMNNDDFPFGYEYVQKATMREINYGEKDIVGEKMTVAGVPGVKKGFTICKYCGKIQTDKKHASHTKYCKTNLAKAPMTDPYEECLFLYREFQTEAIRLLIPATTMDSSNVRVESFVAAIMLGMKSKFGNVDHLRACVSEVPVPDADYRKQYLVLYDSVPGGTGYLKQLMNDKNGMIDILQRALDVMEGCSCKTHDMNLQYGQTKKDGCYRCLYAFRQSQHIGEISRDSAISMLKSILSGVDKLEVISKIGNIEVNSLFESELERRFIEAMRRLGNENRGIEVHKTLVNGKEGYSLTVGQNLWEIELQVELGKGQGIPIDTRADFVLWPKRTCGNHKPIVIFTDGYIYHKDKVHDDTLKRMGIMMTGKYRVWSLSWKDVQHIFHKQDDYKTNTLMFEHMPMGAQMYRPFVKASSAEGINPDKENAFELLVDYLENNNSEDMFKSHAIAYAFSIMDNKLMKNQDDYNKWKSNWKTVLDSMDSLDDIPGFGEVLYGQWKPRPNQGNLNILASVLLSDMPLKMKAPTSIIAVLEDRIDTRTDKYDLDWNGFWHFANIMQFNQHAYFVTTTGIVNNIYTVLGAQEQIADNVVAATKEISYDSSLDLKWMNCMEEFIDDIAKNCATEMMNKHIPAPIVAYELVDDKTNAIMAEAEMAWEELKIAWLLPEQEEYKDIFEKSGWKVILSTDDISEIMFGGEANE